MKTILNFVPDEGATWRPVNDTVMGGVSQSGMTIREDGVGVFSGHLSLENNGGFATVRASIEPGDLREYGAFALRCRGDGQWYRLRFMSDAQFDSVNYQSSFKTEPDQWTEVTLPFHTFLPTFRGRTIQRGKPFDPSRIRQVAFMIADKQEGAFRLEVDWLRATPGAEQVMQATLQRDLPSLQLSMEEQPLNIELTWITKEQAQQHQRPLDIYVPSARVGAFIGPLEALRAAATYEQLIDGLKPEVEAWFNEHRPEAMPVLFGRSVEGRYMDGGAASTPSAH